MHVTLRNADKIFGSMLSGKGGSANGCRCCWGAPGLPRLPPATLKNPPPFIASLLLFVFAEMGATSTASVRLEVNLFKSETRGFGILLVSPVFLGIWRFCIASRSLLPLSMLTKQDSREHVLLRALKIMLHDNLCLSVIILLICVQKGYAGHCLVKGRGDKLGLLSA